MDTHKIENISLSELGTKDSVHIPAAGFTQRATIDPDLGEIYVLSVIENNDTLIKYVRCIQANF